MSVDLQELADQQAQLKQQMDEAKAAGNFDAAIDASADLGALEAQILDVYRHSPEYQAYINSPHQGIDPAMHAQLWMEGKGFDVPEAVRRDVEALENREEQQRHAVGEPAVTTRQEEHVTEHVTTTTTYSINGEEVSEREYDQLAGRSNPVTSHIDGPTPANPEVLNPNAAGPDINAIDGPTLDNPQVLNPNAAGPDINAIDGPTLDNPNAGLGPEWTREDVSCLTIQCSGTPVAPEVLDPKAHVVSVDRNTGAPGLAGAAGNFGDEVRRMEEDFAQGVAEMEENFRRGLDDPFFK